jgi:hypothetical protein
MLFQPLFAIDADQYKVIRISQESLQQSILIAKSDEQYRCIQRWAVAGAAVVAVIALLKMQKCSSPSGEYVLQAGDTIVHAPSAVAILQKQTENSISDMAVQAVYGAGRYIVTNSIDCAKSIASVASSFIGMTLLTLGSQQLGTSWKYFYEVEELSGFIKHETKLHKLFLMIKEFAVPFDIYSERLSMDLNFGQQRILLSDFMKEIIEAVDSSNEWNQNKLLLVMKKDFLHKASLLQEFQNFAVNGINYRQRIELGLIDNYFEIEAMNRMAIVEFCNFLILEIEKVSAFIQIKAENSYMKSYFTDKVQHLIKATNIFAEQVEMKLALPIHDLYEQSKKGDGLFDLICNFNILVDQHIEMMSYRL